jgi:hypothetical protein
MAKHLKQPFASPHARLERWPRVGAFALLARGSRVQEDTALRSPVCPVCWLLQRVRRGQCRPTCPPVKAMVFACVLASPQ